MMGRRVVKELACKKCAGTGQVVNHTSTHDPCRHCEGRGQITLREAGSVYEYDVPCPSCGGAGGTGTSSWSQSRCDACSGTGIRISKPTVRKTRGEFDS
jgi:DnaJ-class molecular chaperone